MMQMLKDPKLLQLLKNQAKFNQRGVSSAQMYRFSDP
jgi:hypothetical protein